MIEICPVDDFPDGSRRLVTVMESGHDRDIAIFRENERFYAIDNACTHVGASHLKSTVKDGVIECWLHKGRFCLSSGEPLRYPARKAAQVYAIHVEKEMIFLDINTHPRAAS